MLHPHTTSAKFADLNSIGLAGEYDVAPDGSAVNKNWEWKSLAGNLSRGLPYAVVVEELDENGNIEGVFWEWR